MNDVFLKDLKKWFDIQNYELLNEANEKEWAEMLSIRLAIFFYLDNPNFDEYEQPQLPNRKSETIFEYIKSEPIKFPADKSSAFKALLLVSPGLSRIRNFFKEDIDSVWALSVGSMMELLRQYNKLEPKNTVLKLMQNGYLNHDETPDWYHDSFHNNQTEINKEIYDVEITSSKEAIIGIDLSASKNHIINDFKKLLNQIKSETNTSQNKQRHKSPVVKDWVNSSLLPYTDIQIWLRLTNSKISRNNILELIYHPDKFKNDESTFRKTTLVQYNKVFKPQDNFQALRSRTIDDLMYLHEQKHT